MEFEISAAAASHQAHQAPLRRLSRTIPSVTAYHRRYFENPFLSELDAIPTTRNNSEYFDQALELARNIYLSCSSGDYQRYDSDLYIGNAGIAYAFDRLLQSALLPNHEREMFSAMMVRLMDLALSHKRREHGLLVGYDGVLVTGALVYGAAGNSTKASECLRTFVEHCTTVDRMVVPDSTGDEIFAGRSGYLAGLLELYKRYPQEPSFSTVPVRQTVEAIIQSGENYSRSCGLSNESPLFFFHYGSDYLGAAHGGSFILQTLLSFPRALSTINGSEQKIRKSVDYILQQELNGNYPAQFGDRETELVHWCHGAPGVIYMLAKAYMFWKDEKYLSACRRTADLIWHRGLLRKGPGICHGIAGNAYTFLMMYRLTQDEKYLYRAQRFADLMFQDRVREHSRVPDHPFSLFEGIAGSLCFYVDLTAPEKASFPFCDVFTDFHLNG